MPATVVLVHGAWHGAWCFERVLPLLAAAGVPAVAVDLPGHADDGGSFADLAGDAAAVRAALDRVEGDAVLLGHSYGGAVITEAGVHPAVRELVYLCAFALDEGESCARAGVDDRRVAALEHGGRPDLGAAFVRIDDGLVTLDADGARACLYHDVDDATWAWAAPRLGPHPLANLLASPSAVAWRSVPSTYVVCTDDQGVHPGLQEVLAERCTRTVHWPVGHSPFAHRPELVADLLIERATGS